MIFVKKAQVMILDTFIFLIIVLIILSITSTIIINYSNNISEYSKKTELLKKEIIVEEEILSCDGLGYKDIQTKICYKNKIEIKNINDLEKIVCKIEIDNKTIINNENKKIISTHKRGVILENNFKILKVSFCEE